MRITIGGAEFAVAFARDALRGSDQHAIGSAGVSENASSARATSGSGSGGFSTASPRGHVRPVSDCLREKRPRIEVQGWVRPQDDPAIAGPGDRGTDDRLAGAGITPPDRNTPVGIVHFNDDVATALRSGEF
jgi:hypothetical protein